MLLDRHHVHRSAPYGVRVGVWLGVRVTHKGADDGHGFGVCAGSQAIGAGTGVGKIGDCTQSSRGCPGTMPSTSTQSGVLSARGVGQSMSSGLMRTATKLPVGTAVCVGVTVAVNSAVALAGIGVGVRLGGGVRVGIAVLVMVVVGVFVRVGVRVRV